MKRVLAFILALVMMLSLFTVCSFAAGGAANVSMEVTPPAGKEMTDLRVGDVVTVTVKNSEMTVSTFGCKVRFDKDVFECTSIAGADPEYPETVFITKTSGRNPDLELTVSTITEANGNGTVGMGVAATDNSTYKAGTIVTITFTVKASGVNSAFILGENSAGTDSCINDTLDTVEAKAYAELGGFVGFNLAKPSKGGTPQVSVSNTSVTGTVYYTGTVAWAPDHTTFAPGTAYTANVTLTPSAGYKFVPSGANATKISYPDGAVSNLTVAADGSTLTFTVLFAATASADPLTGTVTIDGATGGKAKFGDTLTANTDGLSYGSETMGTLGYRWMRDGKGIANAIHNTYTTVEADIGHKISVEVWNSNNTGSVTSDPVTIGKALNGTNPDDPSVGFDGLGQTSITVTYDHEGDYEFACVEWTDGYQEGDISNAVWQDSKTFTGLKPNTPYYIYVRVKATATHEASTAAYTTANTARYEVANDADLKAKLDASVSALNREYNYGWDYPIEVVDQRLPAGWSYSYSTDGRNFSTSKPATIRDVSSSGKYYVKFEHHDYKAYIAEFDVTIRPKDITPKDGVNIVKANYTEPTYTGSALTLSDLVLYWRNAVQDVTLNVGTDVAIAYSNNVNRPYGTITVTAVEGGNYTGSCNVSFTINPKPITPTVATIPNVEYDGGLPRKPKLDITYTGTTPVTTLVEGKDYTVSYTNNKEVGQATATVSPVTALDGTTNYTFVAFDVPFKITRAKFPGTTTGSMNVRSREITTNVRYRLPAILGVEGAEYGDVTTEGDLIAEAHLDTDGRTLIFSTRAKDADTEGKIKIEITQGTNYFADTFVLTVTAKDKEDADVKIDTSKPANVTYGDTFTVTASAAKPGTAAGSWTWVSSDPSILEIVSVGDTNGDTSTVTVKAVKASTTGATLTATYSSETHEDTDTRTYTVAQKPITVSGFGVNAREYDGGATVDSADVNDGNVRVFGALEGDDVFAEVVSGTYDAKNAGSRTATLTLGLIGKDLGNYVLEDPTYTVQNAQITPKKVTIGGATVASSKEYDGTTNADITSTSYTVDGKIGDDKVSVDATNAKASYESKDVGAGKVVTFSGFSLTGDDAKNYKLTAQPTANADITRRTLTVTGITVADKTYDATTDAQITNITYGNIVSGDQVSAKITASFADANAGENKSVTFNVEHLEGKAAGNYELSSSPLPAATATIRKAQLVGAPTFGKITKAGTKLSEVTYDLSGIKGVNGEDVSPAFAWDAPGDTTVEANKAYGWTVTTTPNPNYEDLTGSTVLYPVSTSYSDQVKKQSEEFEAKKRGELPEDELDFRDVYEDDYFFDAVQWAAENGITGGVGNDRFGPNLDCSRGQTMTFLWRASGEPKPDAISTDLTDVAAGSYYYEAVLWAMQEGVTTGAGGNRFAPDATVTRGQFVTFLYRLAGASSDGVHPFADVPAGSYYEKAIAWAFAEGITRGTSGTTFSPDAPCTRAQIITFLYRYFNR